MEYYVFNTKQESDDCLDFVNNAEWFPVTGLKKGQPNPDAIKTIAWADKSTEFQDGKWGFPRIPTATLDLAGVPEDQRTGFISTFNPSIEERTDIVVVEEEI